MTEEPERYSVEEIRELLRSGNRHFAQDVGFGQDLNIFESDDKTVIFANLTFTFVSDNVSVDRETIENAEGIVYPVWLFGEQFNKRMWETRKKLIAKREEEAKAKPEERIQVMPRLYVDKNLLQ